VLRAWPSPRVLTIAGALLTVGTAVTLIGMLTASDVLGAVGTVLAGLGFGASALASFGTLAMLAAPHERGELFAVALTIAYVAFSLPAVIAGLAATSGGLHPNTVGYTLAGA